MDTSLWRTLDATFDVNKYLYHYTNIQKAIKILYDGKLIFSPLTKMNDTSEYKTKVTVDCSSISNITEKEEINRKLDKVSKYFNAKARNIRLFCFSQDSEYDKSFYHCDDTHWVDYERFFDLSGRGCALPRMWAQYASNNEGVCLIFDKAKLLKIVEKSASYYIAKKVEYLDYFKRYRMQVDELNDIYTKICHNAHGVLPIAQMLNSEDGGFIHYNYFVKLKDCQNEREFRILTLIDNDNEFAISNLFDYLVGIVVGEKNDRVYTDVLKLLLGNHQIEIKEIIFGGLNYRIKE